MKPTSSNLYPPSTPPPTALLLLDDGTLFYGQGFGVEGIRIGEVCFNTAMTGYQESITDPSYARQLITFTFPHIGNVGCNKDDMESAIPAAQGIIVNQLPTPPSNYRAAQSFDAWLKSIKMPGIAGIDTRALTQKIRDKGAPNGVLAVNFKGAFDLDALKTQLAEWGGLKGLELAASVSTSTGQDWNEAGWDSQKNTYRQASNNDTRIIAFDYGCKQNILRCLADTAGAVRVVPAKTSADEVLELNPDGIFLSNGPGDPAATADYSSQVIRQLAEANIPIFGICIGHQLIAEAFGAKTFKMAKGHRGANHPVKELATGRIEITSQNHGFAVDAKNLPPELEITHISLFDGSVEGLRHKTLPIFSVQHHPEASPGPHDAQHLFTRFADMIKSHRLENAKT